MKRIVTVLTAALFAAVSWGEVKIDPVFSPNMVLQQQRPITFFGTADKGAAVTVEFDGKKVSVKADENLC